MSDKEQWVVASYYAPRNYFHVYGIFESKALAEAAEKEMIEDSVRSLGETAYRKSLFFWVKKIIDVTENVTNATDLG